MTTIQEEYTMKFNFKIVYTTIVQTIEISSNSTLGDLYDTITELFSTYINYSHYYINVVVAGQKEDEMGDAYLFEPINSSLHDAFGPTWKQTSFYIRPMSRYTYTFIKMDNYYLQPPTTSTNNAINNDWVDDWN